MTSMNIEETVRLAKSLRSETDSLLKAQRRKGLEYRFREGSGRPSLEGGFAVGTGGAAGGDPFSASQDGGGGGSSPTHGSGGGSPMAQRGTGGLAAAAATGPGSSNKLGATGSSSRPADDQGLSLDAYDPKEVAAKEERLLQEQVARLRVDSSRQRHLVETKQKRYEAMQSELLKLKHEDDVSIERDEGVRAMKEERERIAGLQREYDDTLQYEKTLTHVLSRAQTEKLEQLATLRAFEDALRVHKHEHELALGLLRSVHKSREAEQMELAKMRADVKKQLHMLDTKLEARRLEVKARQEKAKWRLAKLQEELSLKAQAEGDLTEEEERAMIERAKNLSHEAAELRTEKLRVQAEADAAEATFHRLRFAAGVSGFNGSSSPSLTEGSAADVARRGSTLPSPLGGSKVNASTLSAPRPGDLLAAQGSLLGSALGERASVADSATGGDTEETAAPDAAPIISRFSLLEEEVSFVEENVKDYSGRLLVLQGQLAALRDVAQPNAREAGDEDEVDLGTLDSLTARTEAAQRQLEHTQVELEESRALKLAVEQSIGALSDRLALLPQDSEAPGAPEDGEEGEELETLKREAFALLSQDCETSVSSEWAASLHFKIAAAAVRLEQLTRDLDSASARRHFAHAVAWLREAARSSGGGGLLKPIPTPKARSRANSIALAMFGVVGQGTGTATPLGQDSPVSFSTSNLSRSGALGGGAALAGSGGAKGVGSALATALLENDTEHRSLQATIEQLVASNECSVRVRPGSGTRPTKPVTGKTISEAVHAFEKSWKEGPAKEDATGIADGSAGAGGATTAATLHAKAAAALLAAGGTVDIFSKEASLQRRRNSRADIQAMFAATASAMTGIEDGDEDEDILKVGDTSAMLQSRPKATGVGATRRAGASAGSTSTTKRPTPAASSLARAGRGGSNRGTTPQLQQGGDAPATGGALKPRARDVQRYLAAAVAMAGDEVDDFLLAQRKDVDEVPTREKLKRNTRVQVRRQAAAAAATTTGAGGGAASQGREVA